MKLAWSERNRNITLLDALGMAGVLGLLVARFIPVARLPFWGCTLRQATGWPCLGCGLTRVADRVAHLNVRGALDANPLGTFVALTFAALAVFMAVHLIAKTRVPVLHVTPREGTWLRWSVVGLVLVNYAWVIAHVRFHVA